MTASGLYDSDFRDTVCSLTDGQREPTQLMTGLILSPTINEFHFNGPLLSLATNIGLLVGTILWSFGCDIWGRRSVTLPLSFASARASSGAISILPPSGGRSTSRYSPEVYLGSPWVAPTRSRCSQHLPRLPTSGSAEISPSIPPSFSARPVSSC